jgi:multiple sugar transport system permease protein
MSVKPPGSVAEGKPRWPKEDPARRGLTRKHREWLAALLFVAPDALGLIVFLAIPMVLSLALGFFDISGFGTYSFAGLTNYKRMFSDPLFLIVSG